MTSQPKQIALLDAQTLFTNTSEINLEAPSTSSDPSIPSDACEIPHSLCEADTEAETEIKTNTEAETDVDELHKSQSIIEEPIKPEPFPVEVIRSSRRVKTVSARLVGGVIQIRAPAWMPQDELDNIVCDMVSRIEAKQRSSHISLEERAKALAATYNLPEPKSIEWAPNQKLRWGSCATTHGKIRISSRLAEVPSWVLDHVIVHELAHLVEANHSPAFYELVNRNPQAEKAEGYLLAFSSLNSDK